VRLIRAWPFFVVIDRTRGSVSFSKLCRHPRAKPLHSLISWVLVSSASWLGCREQAVQTDIGFERTSEQRAELAVAVAQAERGEVLSAADLRAMIKKRFGGATK
jgi:hypothetical protein